MFLVFESSFWFLNFMSKCLNFALIAIYPMKELKLIELSLFLAPGSNGFCCPSLLFLLSFLLGVLLKHRTVLHLKPSPTRCKRYLNIQRCSFFQAFLSQLLNCIINCNDLLQIYFFILQFQSGTADPPTFLEEIFFCFRMRHVLILHFIQVEFQKMPFLSLQISKCSGGGCPLTTCIFGAHFQAFSTVENMLHRPCKYMNFHYLFRFYLNFNGVCTQRVYTYL